MTPSSDPRNYARFIPKEELGDVSQWRFGAVGSAFSPEELDEQAAAVEENERLLSSTQKEAYAKGWQEGLAEGLKQAQAQAERLCHAFIEEQGRAAAEQTAAQLAGVVNALEQGLSQGEQRLAQSVLDLVCTIARQVVRHELAIDPLAVRHVVGEALGLLAADGKPATVRLAPQDMALLQEQLKQEFAGQPLMFMADAAMQPGDCRIEFAGAVVDGSIERRWARAVSGLGLTAQMQADDLLAPGPAEISDEL